MEGNETTLVNSTIAVLKPKIEETIKAVIDGNLAEKLPSLKAAMQNEIWDKAVAEIGKQMNIPADVIKRLQQIDDIVRNNKDGIEKALAGLMEKVEAFKDRLKGIDLTKTVTMSYAELQKEKAKASVYWAIASFALGVLSGIVTCIYWLKPSP